MRNRAAPILLVLLVLEGGLLDYASGFGFQTIGSMSLQGQRAGISPRLSRISPALQSRRRDPSRRQRTSPLWAASDLTGFSFGPREGGPPARTFILLVGIKDEEASIIADILSDMDGLLAAADLIRCTHEDLSGTVGAALDGVEERVGAGGVDKWMHLEGARLIMIGGVIAEEEQEALMIALDETDVRPAVIANVPANPGNVLGKIVEETLAEYDDTWGLAEPLELPEGGSQWDPCTAKCTLNAEIEGAMVFTRAAEGGGEGVRWDTAKVVAVDDFFGEKERAELLALITQEGWDHTKGPPQGKWQKILTDVPGLPGTWGLSPEALGDLCASACPSLLEIQARLTLLYPDYTVCRMPPAVLGEEVAPMVANAPLHGETFSWHIDADPACVPPSPWRDRFGSYYNREANKPLFVTALLYLSEAWPNEWDAETLFLDEKTQTGFFVRPKAGRLVLMDQDVTHRISAPSFFAGGRPRYSLVWKLVMHPRTQDAARAPSMQRRGWGEPVKFGSAAWTGERREAK